MRIAANLLKLAFLLLTSCVLLSVALPRSAAGAIVTSMVDLPVEVKDIKGHTIKRTFKVTIIRDDTRPKSGFMVLNHGRGANAEIHARASVQPYFDNARYFVSKGYAVFLPLRIGYGVTGGPDVEFSGTCAARNYPPGYEAGAAQTVATIAYAKTLPFIDADNGIVVGQSYGGAIAIALAAKGIPGVRAAINFAGGGGGNPANHPEQPCSPDRLTKLFGLYGATAHIPTLWLYSVNDKFFGQTYPREWFRAFAERGGQGRFVTLPPYRQNGHPSFTGNPAAWKPEVEAFLASCCAADAAATPAAAPAIAAPPNAANAAPERAVFTHVLASWAAKHNVRQASIVVRHNGRIVHQAGLGEDPRQPVLLASLSKAITGACIATLVRDGKLTFETQVSTALAKFIARHGRPADPRLEHATIGQLLTHRAGFPAVEHGGDIVSKFNGWLAKHSPRERPGPDYVRLVLATHLASDPGAVFAYSNSGYAVLGAAIEEATGQRYEDYCRAAVLVPTGAAGSLHPDLALLWSFGGWYLDGGNYLAFYEIFDPRTSPLGARAVAWMADAAGKATGKYRYPVWYGLGVRERNRGEGLEIWHTGSWSRQLQTSVAEARELNTSTLAFRSVNGLSFFVHSTPLVREHARDELRDQLIQAAKSIRQWD